MPDWPDWHSVTPRQQRPPPTRDRDRQLAETAVGTTHRDGIPWDQARLPWRWHRCRWQTSYHIRSDWIYRCACGAARTGRGAWAGRNSRRWGRPDAR